MIGAILGDILGSVYEIQPEKDYNKVHFSMQSDFTDDTVLTIAVADALMADKSFAEALYQFGNNYKGRGYGGRFAQWLQSDNPQPYNSFGNGSAMRVSPVGWVVKHEKEALELARASAEPTHNHPEGIKGAQAVALAIYLAREGASKLQIKKQLSRLFHYNLERKYASIQPGYSFDVTCQGSVPEAIIAFMESHDYPSAIRMAVALGGDADTQACIAGAIAEAFYGEIPINDYAVLSRLPFALRNFVDRFYEQYAIPTNRGSG